MMLRKVFQDISVCLLAYVFVAIALLIGDAWGHTQHQKPHEKTFDRTLHNIVVLGPYAQLENLERTIQASLPHKALNKPSRPYENILARMKIGDTLVLLFVSDIHQVYQDRIQELERLDPDAPEALRVSLWDLLPNQQVPEAYQDLLPSSWAEIQAVIKQGKSWELTKQARGFNIVILAAPTKKELETLVTTTKLLHDFKSEPANKASDKQALFAIGPCWEIVKTFHRYVASTSYHHTIYPYEIVTSRPSVVNFLILLFSYDQDGLREIPKNYEDLLPLDRPTLEKRLKEGESVDLTGRSRGLNVILLAAPTMVELEKLIEKTSLLNAFKPKAEDPIQ